MQELLDLTFTWLGSGNPFKVDDAVYRIAASLTFPEVEDAANPPARSRPT
jgi:hypothetical protein